MKKHSKVQSYKNLRGFLTNLPIEFVLLSYAIFQLLPIIWLFIQAFRTTVEIKRNPLGFPTSLYLDNFNLNIIQKFGIYVGKYITNSVIVSAMALGLLLVTALFAAYAIAKLRFPGKSLVIILLISMIGIPRQTIMIPLFYFIAKLNLTNSYFGLACVYAAFAFPFSALILHSYFMKFPDELIQTAKIDGCNTINIVIRIVIPSSTGAIFSVLIIYFIEFWNEFLWALLFMKSNNRKTISIGILLFTGEYYTDWGPMFAVMLIVVSAAIAFYAIFQRQLMRSSISGAIKG